MTYRPLTIVWNCPNCGLKPLIKFRFFRGWRAECPCGISGPFVRNVDHPNNVISAWNKFIRPDFVISPEKLRPPPSRDH